jgi:hypothetical protein
MPRMLLLPDKRDWIFDFLCTHEAEALRKRGWQVDVVYQEDGLSLPVPARRYDMAFNPSYTPRRFERAFHGRLIRGIFGHKWAWSKHPKRALDDSLRGALAVVVPNRELCSMIQWYFPNTFQITEGTDPGIFHFEQFNTGQQVEAAWTGDSGHTWKGLQDILIPACERANVPLRIASDLSRADLNRFYNSVDVVLVATKNEGSPNSVFEAGACGRPIIGTRAGIIPEAVVDGRNGFIVDRTIEAFSDKLLWCKENREKLREMGMAHREVVLRKYTIEEHTRQFCNLLERLLSSRQDRALGGASGVFLSGVGCAGRRILKRFSGRPGTPICSLSRREKVPA